MLTTVFTSLFLSRPTQAESFLHKTACGTAGWLGVQCKTVSDGQSIADSGQGKSAPSGATSSKSAPPAQPSGQATASPLPTSFATMSLPSQQLPTITPVTDANSSAFAVPQTFVSYGLSNLGNNVDGGSGIIGTMNHRILQPSAAGWRIFGIAWYWWLGVIGSTVALGALVWKGLSRISNKRLC